MRAPKRLQPLRVNLPASAGRSFSYLFIYAFVLVLCCTAAKSEDNSHNDNPSGKCVAEKSQEYYKLPQSVMDIANIIALQCAELLPKSAAEACTNQYVCDQVDAEVNRQITQLNRELAYNLISLYRRPGK